MRQFSLLLLLSLAALAPSVATATPECDAIATNGPYFNHTQVAGCLRSVAFDATQAANILDSLLKMVPSYVFVDTSKASPDPVNIPMNTDLIARLQTIKQTAAAGGYAVDADFQQDLADLFGELHDAHTRYAKPSPYTNSVFILPFILSSEVDDANNQGITVHVQPDWMGNYTAVYGAAPFNGVNVDGFRAISIDGKDALTTVSTFAKEKIGYSKDVGARFNLAVDGYGGTFYGMFTFRQQNLQAIPAPTMLWVLQNPATNETFTDTISFLGRYIPPATSAALAARASPRMPQAIIQEEQLTLAENSAPLSSFHTLLPKSASTAKIAATVGDEPGVQTFVQDAASGVTVQLVDGVTGVLKIATWAPANNSQFISSVMTGVRALTDANMQNLIIDLRLNGGGDICLAYGALRFLFPDVTPTIGRYDMKHSPLWNALAEAGAQQMQTSAPGSIPCGIDPEVVGYFTPCAWSAPGGVGVEFLPFSDDSWFNPGETYPRGGVANSAYSSLIHEGCQTAYDMWIPANPLKSLTADNIIAFSDSLCGSSCAVFSRHMQQARKVKTLTVGGLQGVKSGIASFPGGEVEDLPFAISMAAKYGVTDPSLVPAALPGNTIFRYAIREIYPFNSASQAVPLEFVFDPVDFQLPYGSSGFVAGDPLVGPIYRAVAKQFATCAAWQTKPCTLASGSGVHTCVNGVYSTTCSAASCNAGFGEVQDACIACPAGFWQDGTQTACQQCTNAPAHAVYTGTRQTSATCAYSCLEGFGGFTCSESVPKQSSSSGYSSGTVAGASIGSLLAGAAMAGVATYVYFRRRASGYSPI
ncbi:hypothetical protein CAOG_04122 [Capsaspora owczarzaki ATCC 30864]|uniref:Uncharacterized protein n=1 Tax=Capsaspora owczarzaki (strain ATCC 30864) TaxID=595528 RepID=A0A0D2UDZ1_CAPO3|nr:hypothetical protein CAOG_04122 [Capsaspora owczarzaki ATCC 30864]KJE93316.1 hypothetical protein CAOG_004122 [Capsaspora owczarzaki ATCC 30864]|eukprot:XP_004347947.1 hypothetical protein CAOG_04122 [Capsaspora owczarzaki ATCC 30864]